jgi:hypothetical protein
MRPALRRALVAIAFEPDAGAEADMVDMGGMSCGKRLSCAVTHQSQPESKAPEHSHAPLPCNFM